MLDTAAAPPAASIASCSLPVNRRRAQLRRRPPGAPVAAEEVRSLQWRGLPFKEFASWCALMHNILYAPALQCEQRPASYSWKVASGSSATAFVTPTLLGPSRAMLRAMMGTYRNEGACFCRAKNGLPAPTQIRWFSFPGINKDPYLPHSVDKTRARNFPIELL